MVNLNLLLRHSGHHRELFTIILAIQCWVTLSYSSSFTITDYGAVGDGIRDDSLAFTKAWKALCGSKSNLNILHIPNGKTFLVNPITFIGPCHSHIQFKVDGTIVAPSNVSEWDHMSITPINISNIIVRMHWLGFVDVHGVSLIGDGKIDGQGSKWWKFCPKMGESCRRPIALGFFGCSNLHVKSLKHVDSQKDHISISQCDDVTISNLHIHAPKTSPNTDGFDISFSTNVRLKNIVIATGDDCIAINTGCSDINITSVTCGPGHGISIGSLGMDGENAAVERVQIKDCVLDSTQNGVRIKTWQGGSGYAKNILFKNITLIATKNPIVIDQYYCPHKTCSNQTTAVKISNVMYMGIHGTTTSQNAINLKCSQNAYCSNITFDHIDIKSTQEDKQVSSTCINIVGKSYDSNPPLHCLLAD